MRRNTIYEEQQKQRERRKARSHGAERTKAERDENRPGVKTKITDKAKAASQKVEREEGNRDRHERKR